VCNFDNYPYAGTYAKQFIIRSSNVTRRNLITSCYLVNSVRSDNNPQGFNIEKFAVVENKDIEVIERQKTILWNIIRFKHVRKILTDKGYNGYFHTQGAYAGKLKDSISEYLESCQKVQILCQSRTYC
jgi:hypothetical protein